MRITPVSNENKDDDQDDIDEKLLCPRILEYPKNPVVMPDEGHKTYHNDKITQRVNDNPNCLQRHFNGKVDNERFEGRMAQKLKQQTGHLPGHICWSEFGAPAGHAFSMTVLFS